MLPIQITSVQLFRARASDIRKQGCETFFPFLPTTYTIHYYFTYILNLIQRPKTFILLTRILSLTWWQVLCFDTKIFYGVISVIKTPPLLFLSYSELLFLLLLVFLTLEGKLQGHGEGVTVIITLSLTYSLSKYLDIRTQWSVAESYLHIAYEIISVCLTFLKEKLKEMFSAISHM